MRPRLIDQVLELLHQIILFSDVYLDNCSVTALDLGLMHTIDFQKGCYTGQEIIAKNANNIRKRVVKLISDNFSYNSSLPVQGAKIYDQGR